MDTALVFFLLVAIPAFCYGQSDRYVHTYPPYDETDSRTPLTFALLLSFGGAFNSSGGVASVQVALDVINNNPDLLPGYTLHYTLTDTQCGDRTVALDALFQQVLPDPYNPDDPVKLSVMGAGCSPATEPTAELTHLYNLVHISCFATSEELADRTRFRSYFQMLPTQSAIAPAYFGVIRQYGWRRVALIVQNENVFTVMADRLKVLLQSIGVEYSQRVFDSQESIAGLGPEPFDPEARIFIIVSFENHPRELLCKAFHRGLRYPQYMFLTFAWYSPGWWKRQPAAENLSCSSDDRTSVLPQTLGFIHADIEENFDLESLTDTGITGREFVDREQGHLGVPPLYLKKVVPPVGGYCYDATWILARALDLTIRDLESNNSLSRLAWETQGISTSVTFRLENFTYNNDVIMNTVFGHVAQTDLIGVTGRVKFNDVGIKEVQTLRVMQYRDVIDGNGQEQLGLVEIANVISDDEGGFDFVYLPGESDATTWPNNLVPYDGVPNVEIVSSEAGEAAIFIILATAGIIFAVVCIVFNAVFRNKKLIRISSPKLNYLIGVGAIILYTDTYFTVFPTTNPMVVATFCTLTPWLTNVGYSLCYGTVGMKMWRVYYIFDNPSAKKKKALKDWMLVLAVGVLVSIDITILLIYTAVEGYRGNIEATLVPNGEDMGEIEGELAIITRFFIYICDSKARDIYLGVLYGYKGILQILTLVLAFSIRKVKVKGLNDTKYILASTYVSSLVLAVVIIGTYSLKDRINIFEAVFSTGFIFGTTVILGLVFGPKMYGLYKDPDGDQVFDRPPDYEFTTQHTRPATYFSSDVENLRKRIAELEAVVAATESGAPTSHKLVIPEPPVKQVPENGERVPPDQSTML